MENKAFSKTAYEFAQDIIDNGQQDAVRPDVAYYISCKLLQLRADALTSQSHNAAVIDRIVTQLRDAGYSGTLSEMVDAVSNELSSLRESTRPLSNDDAGLRW